MFGDCHHILLDLVDGTVFFLAFTRSVVADFESGGPDDFVLKKNRITPRVVERKSYRASC